ncbi:MAG TPA: hypothetical protein PLA50_19380, partial [Bacteroidia bacterium]|nr:hypothetical protein [Bacteroidia bacterium]
YRLPISMKLPLLLILSLLLFAPFLRAEPLLAGAAKVEIAHPDHPAKENPPFVKALVLSQGETHVVIVSVDAVAIAEIGSIRDPYLAEVRGALQNTLGIPPTAFVVNASHCHAIVAPDIAERTIRAVTLAWESRVPAKVGAGIGREDGVMENRRLKLKSGREADVRYAYSLPPDDEVAAMGPIDPEIGLLRIDRLDSGQPLAAVFQFACHPIMGVPDGSNGADLSGYAAETIEANLGDGDATALFLQGCGGDINPVLYKSVDLPRDAKPLGTRLGLSALAGLRAIETQADAPLAIASETLTLPRADHAPRIAEMEQEIDALAASLKGTTLNFETFLPLYVKYHLNSDYPSEVAGRYLQDELLGRTDWKSLDANNRAAMDAYLRNLRTMEELTRRQINRDLLARHQARRAEAGEMVSAEVAALRVGDFRLVTFPAELTVEIGLGLKERSPHPLTFVSGYTNGYLYYAPTAEQAKNRGGAQEDSDCLLAPEWQGIFEAAALRLLSYQRSNLNSQSALSVR